MNRHVHRPGRVPPAGWRRMAVGLGLATLLALMVGTVPAAAPLTDTTASPHAVVRAVGLDETRWTDGFWFDRFTRLRGTMLPAMERLMAGTNASQYLENFRIAAGLVEGRSRGAPFNDGDYYKLLETAAAVLAVAPDPGLADRLERAIGIIASAQRADGYLHTPVLIRARNGDAAAVPFQDRRNFELYNLGHLMTAACVHHRVTGRTNFLAVARRAADFLDGVVAGGSPEAARGSVCPSHFMGLVELWRTTREPRYLALAGRLFAQRGQIRDGGDDNQDRLPFEEQTGAVGHAVRANYLYAGAADLFLETGDARRFWRPQGPIWTNVVFQKMHITGGCGALYDGASPDGSRDQGSITRTHQAYGRNYQLPSTTAHNETCAAVGNILWNWRLFLATGEARYLDVVELALYNAVLAGVGLDGTNYFYTNPLRVTDPMPVELRWSRSRVPYVSSFCCPPNVLRTLAESAGYAYATGSNAVWVNLYGSGTLDTRVDGRPFRLTQESAYPWNGRVRLTVETWDGPALALRLRRPSWAGGATIRVGRLGGDPGRGEPAVIDSRGYIEVRRAWRSGDTLELDLPMPVRLMEAHPLVEETLNQVAVQRGPMVYCLESADLPPGTRITEVGVPDDIDLVARHDPRLLGGMVVLDGVVRVRPAVPWRGELYREVQGAAYRPARVAFVPYAFWANRGRGEMSVWLPRWSPGGPR